MFGEGNVLKRLDEGLEGHVGLGEAGREGRALQPGWVARLRRVLMGAKQWGPACLGPGFWPPRQDRRGGSALEAAGTISEFHVWQRRNERSFRKGSEVPQKREQEFPGNRLNLEGMMVGSRPWCASECLKQSFSEFQRKQTKIYFSNQVGMMEKVKLVS